MADRRVEHLLIGGGIAGATAAKTLREAGASGTVTLVGRELDAPYHRPPASKGYLQGTESREDTLILPAAWWSENDVELLTRTSVTGLDPEARVATLSTRETVEFESALLATGAMVRRLDVDGAQLEGIHYLRALGNADAIRADTDAAEHVVLIGGSYIGCEVAASLTARGKSCTIVMQESVTLERGFGRQAGAFLQRVLEEHGITVLGERDVARFEGDERVAAVVTATDDRVEADVVVAGVGASPDVMLARKSGLEIGERGGVRTDSRLRTSAGAIFAAGDICEYDSVVHDRPMRIEHEDVAAQQGRTAALNMLGSDKPHDVVPYFFSDLSDWASLEYVGPAHEWDNEIVRGSIDDGCFTVFYVDHGRLAAALTVGRSQDLDGARELISSGRPITRPQVLADPDSEVAGSSE